MHTIYRNIQYKPRIWGLYFASLFSALGAFLMILMVLSISMNIFTALFASLLSLAGLYGYFFFRDNRDEVEYSSRKSKMFRNRITSYTVSDQRIQFND